MLRLALLHGQADVTQWVIRAVPEGQHVPAGRDDDAELVVNPPTTCQIGKHPPAPKTNPAGGQQRAHGGGHSRRDVYKYKHISRVAHPDKNLTRDAHHYAVADIAVMMCRPSLH